MDPGRLVLQPRDVRFDWSGLPLAWIPAEPATSHIINVLHLLLPEGERWFVAVFKRALPLITDEMLREDVIGFIGQETIHAEAHQGVLDYFTAFLGDWILHTPELDRAGAHPVMLDLLRWHGAEEVEHRNVAFDLMVHLDPRYARRIRAMLMAGPTLFYLWGRGARYLVRADPGLDRTVRATWRGFLASARRGLLPSPAAALRSAGLYLRRGYHPSQQFSTRLAVAYLGSSPAARAAER